MSNIEGPPAKPRGFLLFAKGSPVVYKKIMVVVDGSDAADAAIREGLRLAANAGAPVVFVHVMSSYVLPMADIDLAGYQTFEAFEQQTKRESERILARAMTHAKRAGVQADPISVSGEDPATSICAQAKRQRCDLIVIGSHGRTTMQRFLQGSVVTHLITIAKLPILVCKKGARMRAPVGVSQRIPNRKHARPRARTGA